MFFILKYLLGDEDYNIVICIIFMYFFFNFGSKLKEIDIIINLLF